MNRITDKIEVFKKLKELIIKNTQDFNDHRSLSNRYEVWNKKEIVIDERKKNEIYYTGLVVQKDYIGFYFMPIYIQPELSNLLNSNLISRQKGKSCFHIDYLDSELLDNISDALKIGKELYLEYGWL